MDFRIESKDSFKIIGLKCAGCYDDWCYFSGNDHYHRLLRNSGSGKNYYKAPFWQVGAYKYGWRESKNSCIIGAELRDEPVLNGMDIETIPAAKWAVFPFSHIPGADIAGETYARVLSEWFPVSNYIRNEEVPYLEVYGNESLGAPENRYEVWVPVLNK